MSSFLELQTNGIMTLTNGPVCNPERQSELIMSEELSKMIYLKIDTHVQSDGRADVNAFTSETVT
jgi:hypothetical protein